MKRILFILLVFLPSLAFPQPAKEKGLNSINKQKAKAYIEFLASDVLEGREAGKLGGRIAGEYIISVLREIGIVPFDDDNNGCTQPFTAYAKERQTKSRYSIDPAIITEYKKDKAHRKLDLRNILGYIEGKNRNEIVIIGAHYDHLGVDESLADDKIYNGADDNASGVSAVLQIAKAFVESGQQPERTVIFAFWDGEELGCLGSEYFTSNFPDLQMVKGYLNFDMIGRNNDESKPEQVVYFYAKEKPVFKEWLTKDIRSYGLKLKPDYKTLDKSTGGSDNISFTRKGIPVIWYHTDGHPDYHQPSDHADEINWDKLVDITKAAYLNFWNMANLPNY
ncbi:Zn-dependent M28 family amino/carboxypeptidase [Dysgonomonas sp. PFB1-18]|uniref:M28 family metallopeptidase n=1 Tax=unclassified Dysgonomonas TaxID=2630389 RepID=UPI00247502CF|nr:MULTISPECIES: M20/M25/M40 family metallo-hydrolase [unclassified Dysgonomonas]MDH6308471.1 Zn-dependent M28 family amino/carboxypeptidase [Dysgonomonas sp. PF1-14]MDH6337972.1 Zn-dependent M28 family amino/carboxypeptidase [Dysgonomonas sp. PF1-16]MDH6379469.1 Zn-dependent M28 family amino/carboxypeptidase [Dysgonomonas sp. PFB1-18]MDH6396800.1 Zn-dependent M28 family amino/carboxypeptidase [Dysgonomonas sp. PF1-23]